MFYTHTRFIIFLIVKCCCFFLLKKMTFNFHIIQIKRVLKCLFFFVSNKKSALVIYSYILFKKLRN